VSPNFVAVNLVEHFVSPTGIEVVRNVVETGFAIALHKHIDPFSLLTHGVFAA